MYKVECVFEIQSFQSQATNAMIANPKHHTSVTPIYCSAVTLQVLLLSRILDTLSAIRPCPIVSGSFEHDTLGTGLWTA